VVRELVMGESGVVEDRRFRLGDGETEDVKLLGFRRVHRGWISNRRAWCEARRETEREERKGNRGQGGKVDNDCEPMSSTLERSPHAIPRDE
jgi:hypothetical protein